MAYKPYKTKKEKDIYARYDGKNTKANNYDNGSVKLFGFRSGAVYKMVPAILYYAFIIFYIGQAFTVNLVIINLNQWTM